jgi:VanZ family protein
MKQLYKYMILFTYLILISLLSLLPSGVLPVTQAGLFPHADKVAHFGMYAILTFLIFYTWPEHFYGNFRQFLPFLYVILWGTTMEIFQGLGGYGRNFSYLDMVANTIGFFPGWLAWRWFFNKKFQEAVQSVRSD